MWRQIRSWLAHALLGQALDPDDRGVGARERGQRDALALHRDHGLDQRQVHGVLALRLVHQAQLVRRVHPDQADVHRVVTAVAEHTDGVLASVQHPSGVLDAVGRVLDGERGAVVARDRLGHERGERAPDRTVQPGAERHGVELLEQVQRDERVRILEHGREHRDLVRVRVERVRVQMLGHAELVHGQAHRGPGRVAQDRGPRDHDAADQHGQRAVLEAVDGQHDVVTDLGRDHVARVPDLDFHDTSLETHGSLSLPGAPPPPFVSADPHVTRFFSLLSSG